MTLDASTPGAPARILVVDDEAANRKLFEALLVSEGYVTVHAASGTEALATIAHRAPDLILLDVMMPGMDGYEVTRRIKTDPATAGIPIIIVTAHADHGARIDGLAAGAEDFLTKPVDRTELWLRIRNLLRLKRTEESLRLARDEADRANHAKSAFLSRMSHELRTPLNAMLGFSQILLMDDLTDDQRENLNFVCSAGHHLLDLVNDVLDITRIEVGALGLSLEPLRVSEVMAYALSLIRPEAARHGVLLPAYDDEQEEHVLADRQCLLQVLLNLLSNAVKYNRPGGSVEVTCATVGATVSITVRDTGPGISEADLAKLFVPFERLGAEATGIAGTGIGLALSRAFSQQMGGSLSARSSVGVGTMLTLELPSSEPVGAPTPGPPDLIDARELDAAPEPSVGAPEVLTVLAIEDNLANTRLLKRVMDIAANVELLSTIQGRLGFDLAMQHLPGLILLDLNLPDVPGIEVLRLLRAEPATASIPIVICSADASSSQQQQLLDLGASAYLTKPFDLPDLYRLVEDARAGRPLLVDPNNLETTPCTTCTTPTLACSSSTTSRSTCTSSASSSLAPG